MLNILAILTKVLSILELVKKLPVLFRLFKVKREVENMDTKGILQSKTIWGIVISLLAIVAKKNGITIDEVGLTNDIVAVIGQVLALYGRFRAEKKITGLIN